MTLPAKLLADLADATRLASITSDPQRMIHAAEWLAVISAKIKEQIEAKTQWEPVTPKQPQ